MYKNMVSQPASVPGKKLGAADILAKLFGKKDTSLESVAEEEEKTDEQIEEERKAKFEKNMASFRIKAAEIAAQTKKEREEAEEKKKAEAEE